jgi:hypothetical protein
VPVAAAAALLENFPFSFYIIYKERNFFAK